MGKPPRQAQGKPVILTGLRANNELHLGNYLGALLPMAKLQKKYAGKYQINIFVPDLHSFTTAVDHNKLHAQTLANLKFFAAAGIDFNNPATYIYRQSFIAAHSELTVILNSFTSMGEMRRMTQFKEKSTDTGSVSVGLFDYPVLMAADILLYSAQYVPVGDDQTQHLEFARDLAERLNNKFGGLFALPKPVKQQHLFFGQEQGLRIRDLNHPEAKMSKSADSERGVIFLNEKPDSARQKIISATTDSLGKINFDMENQAGVSNLLQILCLLTQKPLDAIIRTYQGKKEYGPLKEAVAGAVADFLADFQARLAKIDQPKLLQKVKASEAAMNIAANVTLERVQKAVGLR